MSRGRFRAPGTRSSATRRAVAEQSETVLVAVFDDEQLEDVLAGDDGILAATPAPAVVCVLSTVKLATLLRAAADAKEAGIELIDCGVTGGQGLRTRGKIVVLAGGSDEALAAARPALDAF